MRQVYYSLHTTYSLKQCETITHSFFEKQTHIQGREKMILTQRYITTLLKNYANF